MEANIISDNREMIIHVLETELGERAVISGSPHFTCRVGNYSLLRDGRLIACDNYGDKPGGDQVAEPCGEPSEKLFVRGRSDSDRLAEPCGERDEILDKLVFLGLCEYPKTPAAERSREQAPPGCLSAEMQLRKCSQDNHEPNAPPGKDPPEQLPDNVPYYTIRELNGSTLLNLFCIISARQLLLNQALAARGAFRVSRELMEHLTAHPPQTVSEILQALYGFEDEYAGLEITRTHNKNKSIVSFTGFERCRKEESQIHRQLADHIMQAARTLKWIKPYTRNVRNRKFAMHTWLYQIGMAGPEYEDTRSILLGRLYGNISQRKIER